MDWSDNIDNIYIYGTLYTGHVVQNHQLKNPAPWALPDPKRAEKPRLGFQGHRPTFARWARGKKGSAIGKPVDPRGFIDLICRSIKVVVIRSHNQIMINCVPFGILWAHSNHEMLGQFGGSSTIKSNEIA